LRIDAFALVFDVEYYTIVRFAETYNDLTVFWRVFYGIIYQVLDDSLDKRDIAKSERQIFLDLGA